MGESALCHQLCGNGRRRGDRLHRKDFFEVPAAYQDAVLRVQAVNEYGGLSAYGKASLSTGIDEIAAQQRSDDKGWYNMMGMKVSATSKGVLIHQHKKVIVK